MPDGFFKCEMQSELNESWAWTNALKKAFGVSGQAAMGILKKMKN